MATSFHLLTCESPHLPAFLNRHVFLDESSSRRECLLHLGDVVVLGSFGRRIPCGANVINIPQFRDLACPDGICQRAMDERWGLLGISHDFESVLEICLPLH